MGIFLNIIRTLWKYFQNIAFQGDQEKLSPKDLQVNTSLPQGGLTHLEQNFGWEELLVKLKDDWNTGNLKKSETVGIDAEEINTK